MGTVYNKNGGGASGTLTITANGEYDVSKFKKIKVELPSTSHTISGSSWHGGNTFNVSVQIDGATVWTSNNNNPSSFSRVVD